MRSGDEPVKYSMANSVTINLYVFFVSMNSQIVGKNDCILVIKIYGHGTLY